MSRSSEKQSKSSESPSQASHQEEMSEDEYGGSTEKEEEEEEGGGEEAAGPATASASQGEEGLIGWGQVQTNAYSFVFFALIHSKDTFSSTKILIFYWISRKIGI